MIHYKAAILTVSDKASISQRIDTSGPKIKEILEDHKIKVVFYQIVPDEKTQIKDKLIDWSKEVNLILTTGGTGLSPRDITPEATIEVIDRQAPGFVEAIRQKSIDITPNAMLSRAVSGILNKTLIINLPGSLKAVIESLDVIMPVIPHALDVLEGLTVH